MCDEWMPFVKMTMSLAEFDLLPRHPAYKYEFMEGQAWLTPRPKFYHAILHLERFHPDIALPDDIQVRPVADEDVPHLEAVFAAAFSRQQPYASLEDAKRLEAARQALAKVRGGSDGPWMREASFVAVAAADVVGAIFVTLLPDADPTDWDSFRWREPPPADWRVPGAGRPHVTWIFVSEHLAGQGAGTALLAAAVTELRRMNFRSLASTFMLGNESSMLWHWRNGFVLQTYPGSQRLWKSKWARMNKGEEI
jgi:GNAT superfamily N-acetyltransferase